MLRIYKSSAGSGKTYTLVKEFIRLALAPSYLEVEGISHKGEEFKHILALTFTNKAANEMKERIISTLVQIKNNDVRGADLIKEISKETKLNEADLIENAGKVLRTMLHNYSDISVSTIDSFTHRVIRSFAHDLHLPMNFEVEMDRDKLLTETIEILMDRLSDGNDPVTNAVIDFAESNIEEGKSWNLENSLINLSKELFNEDAFPHLEKLNAFDFNEVKKVREALHKYATSFEQKLFDEGKKAFDLIVSNGLTSQHFYQTDKGIFGFFKKYCNSEFPNDALGNSYVLKAINEDKWAGSKNSPSEKAMIEDIKERLVLHYKNICECYGKQSEDYFLAKLLLRNFYAFILLADIQKLMDEYKKENNILHISEFQKKIHGIVKEQDAPVIYERIGDWYGSILIDEHQDTSVLQWQNLLPLIENAQFKSADSLVVGDGKQAIYRFRNGKVEQFAMLPKIYGTESDWRLKAREVAITNYGTETKNLVSNYRSRKEIVDFNNGLYETLSKFPELLNKDIYENNFQKQGRKETGGYVSIEFLKKDGPEASLKELRCERIETVIFEARQKGYALKDIAVLTRTNLNGSIIASYLIEKGIHVVSSESLLIDNSPKVKLILSVVGYFDRKEDHIARAEVAYYIHLLLLKKDFRFENFDFRCNETVFEKNISELTGKEFRSYNFLSYQLDALIQELISFFNFCDDDPFLQFFCDEIMVFCSRNRSNIREFLEWWEEVKSIKSVIYPETLNAVKIMTIHKSKGLQFPVVIMADADWLQKNSKKNFWVELDKPWLKNFEVGILPVAKDVTETEFAYLYEEEEANSFLDMLNLVYVATTRAEDMLYILSTELKKDSEKNNSVTALFTNYLKQLGLWDGYRMYEFGDFKTSKLQRTILSEHVYAKSKTNAVSKGVKQITIRKNSQLLWNEEKVEKINRGKLLHEILKQIKYSGDAGRVIEKMFNRGVLDKDERKRCLDEVLGIINHPYIKKYFETPYRVISERALLASTSTKIPDRVVIEGNNAVVIDYKTGEKESTHKQQLNEYADELVKFGFSEVKKILVYTETNRVQEI